MKPRVIRECTYDVSENPIEEKGIYLEKAEISFSMIKKKKKKQTKKTKNVYIINPVQYVLS
jgi:hypothetical protein